MKVYKIINDVDELIYIGSTKETLSRRMTQHRRECLKGTDLKLYNHMRIIGVEHFKILLVREYTDISKEKLRKKEDKYIKKYDTVKNGLNRFYAYGHSCEHNKRRARCVECGSTSICEHNMIRERCVECGGSSICEHKKRKDRCKICSPATCEICQKIYPKDNLKQHMKKKHSN